MSDYEVEVFHPNPREICINLAGRRVTFVFNPETGYVIVPTGVYKSEDKVMSVLRDEDDVKGIFHHRCVSEV